MLVGDLECAFAMLERSPSHLFLYLFYSNRKTKNRTNKAAKTLRSLNFYFYYLFIYLFILLYFIRSPNFSFFNKTQTRLR